LNKGNGKPGPSRMCGRFGSYSIGNNGD